MKQFFESYGGVALGILALLVLIAMITPVGNIIKTSLQGTTNKFASSMNGQLDDAMIATTEAQKSATQTSSIKMNNINKNGVVGDFSSKGNLVTINGTQYRVLEVNGTQAKVMSMENIGSSRFSNSSTYTTNFTLTDSTIKEGQKYADSILDNMMTNYYNSLPDSIIIAIIPQTIKQSMYSYSNPMRLANKKGEVEVGKRYVYILDIDDVIEYLGDDYSSSNPYVVNEMFFMTTNGIPKSVWLRSAHPGINSYAFGVSGNGGYFSSHDYFNNLEVRPAFVIDLSLL